MADTSVKLSGTYDSIEAYNIMVEMQNMSADYEEIRTEAAAAASAATAAVTTAQTAANNASTYAGNAQTYAGNANTSAGEAAGYASDASTSATNAATSETNASNSASAAATSASNAAASEAVVSGALPLTGGTMTGKILGTSAVLGNANDTDKMFILGGTSTTDSPSIMMSPKNGADGGVIQLQARNGSTFVNLNAFSNGSLTWDGKEIERVNAKGTNYIRYESGLQIVFDRINMSGATSYVKTYTYPVAFVGDVTIVTGNRWAANNEQISIQHDNTTKFEISVTNADTNEHNMFFISIGRWK